MNVSKKASKKAFAVLAGGVSVFSAYKAMWEHSKYVEAQRKFEDIHTDLAQFKPVEIAGKDARVYPWYKEGLENWEYKLVKIRGYFKEERFFVKRDREGKPGYLVLAPFITSYNQYSGSFATTEHNPAVESGLMVNLGWVPADNKDDIEMGGEPLDLVEPHEEGHIIERDAFTGLTNNPDNIIEDEVFSLTDLVGIVRRGENQDLLNRRVNFKDDAVFQYIDLPWLSRFFRFFNTDAAGTAYIERMVPEYDEDAEDLYPVPATKDTFIKPLANPNAYKRLSTFYGGASAISLATILLYALK